MTPFPFLDFTQVMARLKNKEVPESADEIKNVDTAPETTPEVPASVDANPEDVVTENVDTNTNDDKLPQDPAPEEKKEKKTSKRGSKSESQATPEVPASVDAVLKKFSQYDELYVLLNLLHKERKRRSLGTDGGGFARCYRRKSECT